MAQRVAARRLSSSIRTTVRSRSRTTSINPAASTNPLFLATASSRPFDGNDTTTDGTLRSSLPSPSTLLMTTTASRRPLYHGSSTVRSNHHGRRSDRRFFGLRAAPPSPEERPGPGSTPAAAEGAAADGCPSWNNPILHARDAAEITLSDRPPDAERPPPPPVVPLPPLDLENDGKTLAAPHLHALAHEIVELNMLEVKELVDRVAEHFDIEDDNGAAAAASGGGVGEEETEAEEEEKIAFDLKLVGFDAKSKIKVIKEVRAITALGLKEAKGMVDGAPKVLKSGIKKEEAEELKGKLEAVGAVVEIV